MPAIPNFQPLLRSIGTIIVTQLTNNISLIGAMFEVDLRASDLLERIVQDHVFLVLLFNIGFKTNKQASII